MSDDEPGIVFTQHGARRGLAWLVQARAMLWQARLPWLMMLFTYYVVLAMIDLVPFIGQIAVPLLKPVFAVGFLAAAWTQERGGSPRVGQLFQGFRSNLRALLPLGLVFVAGITLAVLSTSLIDGGMLLDVMSTSAGSTDDERAAYLAKLNETLSDPRVELAMLFAALCAVPTLFALWWAPALVVFQDMGAGAALRTSLRAALTNWKPLAIYGLAVFFFGLVLPAIVLKAISMVLPGAVATTFAFLFVMPYLFFFVATLHISDYVSYRDVFHAGETLSPITEQGPAKKTPLDWR